ncbi:MAG TPA: hypothetical protein VFV38_19875 [Ktedonobacteraceae bacterium]|nr:hypothetical protein [Ktedonobacteraceae bacterium]
MSMVLLIPSVAGSAAGDRTTGHVHPLLLRAEANELASGEIPLVSLTRCPLERVACRLAAWLFSLR